MLNLHDGHGFYRKEYQNELFNPKAWGQAFIIDQQILSGTKYGKLDEIASKVAKQNRVVLREDVHEFNVKNTQTKDKDEAMRQSLTYFAIQNKKPAFAIETSKNISDLSTKMLYQLKSLEEFMSIMGIKFKRDFELNQKNVERLLRDFGEIEIMPLNIKLPLSDLRPQINYFPIEKNGMVYKSKNPLVAISQGANKIDIFNGNIKVTSLSTQSYEFCKPPKEIEITIDGKDSKTEAGKIVEVKRSFKIVTPKEYRLNIIGFSKKGVENESGEEVSYEALDKNYSLDKAQKLFRAEIYKGKNFCGMIILKFK